jgi:hypothetical protein
MESHPRGGKSLHIIGDQYSNHTLTEKGKIIHTCLRLDSAHRGSWDKEEMIRRTCDTWDMRERDVKRHWNELWRDYTMWNSDVFIIQPGPQLADRMMVLEEMPDDLREWFEFSQDHIEGYWQIDPSTDKAQILAQLISDRANMWHLEPRQWPTRSEIATTVGVNDGRITELVNPNDVKDESYNQHGGVIQIDDRIGLGLPENHRLGQSTFDDY